MSASDPAPKLPTPAGSPAAKSPVEARTDGPPHPPAAAPPPPSAGRAPRRLWLVGAALLILLTVWLGVPWLLRALRTVSTDDAYVNGHVTFVAPRVAGQVMTVLVDDNYRVRKSDLLVQLDKEPYQVQLHIAQAAVAAADADLMSAQADARAVEGQMRSLRFNLDHAMEDVDNQVALLRAKVATLNSQKAVEVRAQADLNRAEPLVQSGAVTKEELDLRRQLLAVAKAQVEEALQGVYQQRVSLGLPLKPETGDDLAQVPANLNQTFSTVRQVQANVIQAAARIGLSISFDKSPKEMYAEFYKRDPEKNVDRIYAQLLQDAPSIKQAETKLGQAKRNLDQAALNLKYCDIVSEIDGVVTRRNVNPGNNVVVGQSLMAVRSLTEIWIDANFKETQLAELRIGQPVDVEVDMYGSRKSFQGRITGFTMGTGSTLALLPPENATGNFVKVVQRLPVRIELTDYDPAKQPLFVGLSVTPFVRIKEAPTGPNAGEYLQPDRPASSATPPEKRP
jgi:membrane fusion protein (multidrug efflux system)